MARNPEEPWEQDFYNLQRWASTDNRVVSSSSLTRSVPTSNQMMGPPSNPTTSRSSAAHSSSHDRNRAYAQNSSSRSRLAPLPAPPLMFSPFAPPSAFYQPFASGDFDYYRPLNSSSSTNRNTSASYHRPSTTCPRQSNYNHRNHHNNRPTYPPTTATTSSAATMQHSNSFAANAFFPPLDLLNASIQGTIQKAKETVAAAANQYNAIFNSARDTVRNSIGGPSTSYPPPPDILFPTWPPTTNESVVMADPLFGIRVQQPGAASTQATATAANANGPATSAPAASSLATSASATAAQASGNPPATSPDALDQSVRSAIAKSAATRFTYAEDERFTDNLLHLIANYEAMRSNSADEVRYKIWCVPLIEAVTTFRKRIDCLAECDTENILRLFSASCDKLMGRLTEETKSLTTIITGLDGLVAFLEAIEGKCLRASTELALVNRFAEIVNELVYAVAVRLKQFCHKDLLAPVLGAECEQFIKVTSHFLSMLLGGHTGQNFAQKLSPEMLYELLHSMLPFWVLSRGMNSGAIKYYMPITVLCDKLFHFGDDLTEEGEWHINVNDLITALLMLAEQLTTQTLEEVGQQDYFQIAVRFRQVADKKDKRALERINESMLYDVWSKLGAIKRKINRAGSKAKLGPKLEDILFQLYKLLELHNYPMDSLIDPPKDMRMNTIALIEDLLQCIVAKCGSDIWKHFEKVDEAIAKSGRDPQSVLLVAYLSSMDLDRSLQSEKVPETQTAAAKEIADTLMRPSTSGVQKNFLKVKNKATTEDIIQIDSDVNSDEDVEPMEGNAARDSPLVIDLESMDSISISPGTAKPGTSKPSSPNKRQLSDETRKEESGPSKGHKAAATSANRIQTTTTIEAVQPQPKSAEVPAPPETETAKESNVDLVRQILSIQQELVRNQAAIAEVMKKLTEC